MARVPNTRVVKLSKGGKFIKWWGGKGTNSGQFNVPHSIAIDSKGRVYVADRSNNRIQIFGSSEEIVGGFRLRQLAK
jgi:peptidylamidoglycolate lyase